MRQITGTRKSPGEKIVEDRLVDFKPTFGNTHSGVDPAVMPMVFARASNFDLARYERCTKLDADANFRMRRSVKQLVA